MILEQFHTTMRSLGFSAADKIAVAVSGGGDSVALLLLLKSFGANITALTVDHGLRAESANEALGVAALAQQLNIPHKILTWQGDKPKSHIQERARMARYDLLLQACRDLDIGAIAFAHNLEDQAETFWMRLSHGSGLDGLAGMAPSRIDNGVRIIRPLLNVRRDALRDYCASKNVAYVDDPSNVNEKYLRPRLRAFETALAAEGFTPERLSSTMQKLDDAKDALTIMTDRALSIGRVVHVEGYVSLSYDVFKSEPREIRRRMLALSLGLLSAAGYPPTLVDTCDAIAAPDFAGCTLQGCEIFKSKDKLLLTREPSAVAKRMKLQDGMVWDDRFVIHTPQPLTYDIAALGEAGLATLRKQAPDNIALELLPFKVKKTLPALWQGQNLVAVPHVSWFSDTADVLTPSLQVSFPVKVV